MLSAKGLTTSAGLGFGLSQSQGFALQRCQAEWVAWWYWVGQGPQQAAQGKQEALRPTGMLAAPPQVLRWTAWV